MLATTEIRMNATSAGLLRQAEDLLRAGDKRRASGKAWEAVEHILYEIMREREWDRSEVGDHDEMGYLLRFGSLLSKEADDRGRFLTLLAGAGSTYVNSHEDWHTDFMVRGSINGARELITLLERIAEPIRRW